MSTRDGGHYDSAGNWWAPPLPSPPRWERVRSAIVTVILVAAVLVVIGAWGWYSISHRAATNTATARANPS